MNTTDQTRVWIYRSTKKLNPEQEAEINQLGKQFINQWQSHGNKLKAEFQVLHHHFIVFFVDQSSAMASGCSIDTSVGLIREIEAKHHLGLLDRQKMAFQKADEIVFYEFNELKDLYEQKVIDEQSIIFDPLVQTMVDFQNGFMVPFAKSPYFRTVS